MEKQFDSPAKVAEFVKRALRKSGTMKEAAERLGIAQSTLSTQLEGIRYLNKRTAARYAAEFGFSERYLTTGDVSEFDERITPAPPSIRQIPLGVGADQAIHESIKAIVYKMNDLRKDYLSLVAGLEFQAEYLSKTFKEYPAVRELVETAKKAYIPML